MPETSPVRVKQVLKRMRNWARRYRLPLLLAQCQGNYALEFTGPFLLSLPLQPLPLPSKELELRALIESLGGTFDEVQRTDIPQALLDFAHTVAATQLVLGASRRGRFSQILTRGVAATTTALSGTIDVHVVTHEHAAIGLRGPQFRRRPVRRPGTSTLEVAGRELRTPLAAAKAAVESLLSTDITWTPMEREELLAAARDSLDLLDHAVTNLLDATRP